VIVAIKPVNKTIIIVSNKVIKAKKTNNYYQKWIKNSFTPFLVMILHVTRKEFLMNTNR
jgi:hypothetical protein